MHFPAVNSKSRCKSSLFAHIVQEGLGLFCLIFFFFFVIISLVPFPSLVLARSKTLISDSNPLKHSHWEG